MREETYLGLLLSQSRWDILGGTLLMGCIWVPEYGGIEKGLSGYLFVVVTDL